MQGGWGVEGEEGAGGTGRCVQEEWRSCLCMLSCDIFQAARFKDLGSPLCLPVRDMGSLKSWIVLGSLFYWP